MQNPAPLEVRRQGAIAYVQLNRPAARNALNLAMCHALRTAFEDLDSDPDIHVVLLSGNGPTFCAGADLKERQGKSEQWMRQRRAASFAAYEAIERCAKPVIGLAHGKVLGSGGEITLSCDFAIAAADSTFSFPEPQLGTVGATQRLQRAVGKRRAKDLLLTRRILNAPEAAELGLVTRVVPPGDLSSTGDAVAQAIAECPPLAVTLTKQAIDLGAEVDLRTGIRIEMAAIERNVSADGWRLGVESFVSGRENVTR